MDRLTPTIIEEPGYEDLPEFIVRHRIDLRASMPCNQEDKVDKQRGCAVFRSSIRVFQRLNALGWGLPRSCLELNLVYNPQDSILATRTGVELRRRVG